MCFLWLRSWFLHWIFTYDVLQTLGLPYCPPVVHLDSSDLKKRSNWGVTCIQIRFISNVSVESPGVRILSGIPVILQRQYARNTTSFPPQSNLISEFHPAGKILNLSRSCNFSGFNFSGLGLGREPFSPLAQCVRWSFVLPCCQEGRDFSCNYFFPLTPVFTRDI